MLQHLERTYIALFREYPELLRLGVVAGAGQIAFALVNVYALPMYLIEDLHVSGVALGATSATFLVCEMALKFPMGRLSDRLGRKPFIVLGPLLICLSPTLVARLPLRLWALVFPLRVADGVGAAALWPPLFAMIGDLVRPRSRAAAMSAVNTVYVAAIGVAAALGALVAHAAHSNRFPFYVASGLLLVAAVVGYWGLPRSRPAAVPTAATPAEAAPAPAPYPMFLVLLISLLMTMGALTLASFALPYLKFEFGLSGLGVGGLLAALGVPVLLLGLPLGHAADRWGRTLAVRLSLGASAALMWLVPSCHSLVAFSAVAVLLVLSQILGIPAWLAVVSELAPTNRRGGVMGMVATAEGAGAALGPVLGGLLWDRQHADVFYGAAAILTLAALVAALALRREPAPTVGC
ncbi:MAG TPA: MFS transporter [Armatimonadota bacterium]|nr:MFS transporter [Armatimonadota bacterium]